MSETRLKQIRRAVKKQEKEIYVKGVYDAVTGLINAPLKKRLAFSFKLIFGLLKK